MFDQYGDYLHNGDGRWQERLSMEPDAAKKQLHEWASFIRLANNGHVVMVKAENAVGKNPDLVLDGTVSEVKTQTGSSRNTMGNLLRFGKRQAQQVLVDLFRSKLSPEQAVSDAMRVFRLRNWPYQRIIIVTVDGTERVIVDE
ncbi:MAG: hypothetical protein SPI77_09270 [Corynebacterium sp.]|nr:hypothetical protein [Corynebacterium sp.]